MKSMRFLLFVDEVLGRASHLTSQNALPSLQNLPSRVSKPKGPGAVLAERPAEGAVQLWRVVLEEAQELSPQDGPPQDI